MLDTSIAQPIWPALGILIGLSLLVGAIAGEMFRQWRMFVIVTALTLVVLDQTLLRLRLLPFWADLTVMISGMTFYTVAWFRERNRLMSNVDPN